MAVALLMQGVSIALSFVCRTIFAKLLAAEYLGLGGLFSNIISVLSLSELGIGSVIIVNLYKPIADNDEERISKLMNFYRKAYNIIGAFVIVCGLIITPFLGYIVKSDNDIPHLGLYFILFIIQAASSYFFAYKQSLLTAAQKEYICSLVRQGFNILMNVLQIVFLIITKQYVAYLIVAIVTNIGTNLVLSIITDKKFAFLKKYKRENLTKSETKGMLKNVSSMMLHKVGNTVINSTDNILISSMVGVIYTGLYSNYLLIMNVITQIATIALNAMSASIGDFNARKSREERIELFDAMRIFSYWMFGMCAICFCCLYQPTIELWLGKEYLLSYDVVLIISVNFFINGIIRIPSTFCDVNGLYTKTKFKPIAMAIINLVISIVCLHFWGLVGVFIGTLVSYLTVAIWVDPLYLYKEAFKRPLIKYFISLLINVALVAVIGTATYFVTGLIPNYVLKVLVCGLLSNLLFFLVYFRTNGFKFILSRVKSIIKRKRTN